jgi:hypothetical protein
MAAKLVYLEEGVLLAMEALYGKGPLGKDSEPLLAEKPEQAKTRGRPSGSPRGCLKGFGEG